MAWYKWGVAVAESETNTIVGGVGEAQLLAGISHDLGSALLPGVRQGLLALALPWLAAASLAKGKLACCFMIFFAGPPGPFSR